MSHDGMLDRKYPANISGRNHTTQLPSKYYTDFSFFLLLFVYLPVSREIRGRKSPIYVLMF